GVRVGEERGRITQAAADATRCGMDAILGLGEGAAAAACTEAGAELCNIKSPGQLVIGGLKAAVERACALALERGAKRAIPLDVGGAFHTSLMQPAVPGMTDAVAAAGLVDAKIAVVANNTAEPMSDAATISAELTY